MFMAICMLMTGCRESDPTASSGSDSPALTEVLGEVCFVDPSDAALRSDAQYKQVTDQVTLLQTPTLKEKGIECYVYRIRRNGQWWIDSVHKNSDLAFGRQTRLIDAKLVAPMDCRVSPVYLDTP